MSHLPVKVHLPYDEQLARMNERGLTYVSRARAMTALKRIGYYRLSAYTYPFRAPLEVNTSAADSFKPRSPTFLPGSTLENALHLYSFDEKLRLILLGGLNVVEVGLGVRVAYILGKRHPLAHLDVNHLHAVSSTQILTTENGHQLTQHAAWITRYEKLRKDALQEEYVKHHVLRYGGHIPIWVATEFLDFGCLLRLFNMMTNADKKKVSEELGLPGDNHDTLYRWMKALNILRNHCAHSNRVWNRSSVDVPPKVPTTVVGERLHHVNELDNAKRLKLYYLASLIAYLIVEIDPETNWPRTFMTHARTLGDVQGLTLETSMGFPSGWDKLHLWQYTPVRF